MSLVRLHMALLGVSDGARGRFLAQGLCNCHPLLPRRLGTWLGRCPAAGVVRTSEDSRQWLAEG